MAGSTYNPNNTTRGQLADPLRPRLPRQRSLPPIDTPQGNIAPTSDPYEQAMEEERRLKDYVDEHWVQQLVPIRTRCFRCGADSPIVHVPPGSVLFGERPRRSQSTHDVTKETILAFAKEGWKFQLRKSYCPACKNLGAI